jgi:translation initiation factor 4A
MPIKEGRDIIAQAQSGTGKTGTFCIGSISRVDPTLKHPQVLCLVPTRELAEQIEYVAKTIGSHFGIRTCLAVGKTPVQSNLTALDRGVHFVVGTPGRVYDLIKRRALQTSHIKNILVDEADQMLEKRFREQLQCILELGFPETARCALFSATMNEEVVEFAESILQDPVRILIPPEQVNLSGLRQYKVELAREDWKFDTLLDLYKNMNITQALIYCNRKQKAEWLAEKMTAAGYPITCIHGDLEISERMARMTSFRKGETRVLISTDLLSRGIDVQTVSLVINYELPHDFSVYIHRIGRCARYGRKGTAINLVCGEELQAMKEIDKFYDINIGELPMDLSAISL